MENNYTVYQLKQGLRQSIKESFSNKSSDELNQILKEGYYDDLYELVDSELPVYDSDFLQYALDDNSLANTNIMLEENKEGFCAIDLIRRNLYEVLQEYGNDIVEELVKGVLKERD